MNKSTSQKQKVDKNLTEVKKNMEMDENLGYMTPLFTQTEQSVASANQTIQSRKATEYLKEAKKLAKQTRTVLNQSRLSLSGQKNLKFSITKHKQGLSSPDIKISTKNFTDKFSGVHYRKTPMPI